ncbi:MAG: triphosphoribosyl-dephospho-CoA synthase [Gemmatimonadales bacterium]|nr:triphosphoribosyl-dephospho-CoA synthase [Gemmatimonadales bacterium]
MHVAEAASLACLLEASARKPGNVAPGRAFRDTRYEDFLASAVAIGPVLGSADSRPLGETVRRCLEATRRWTRANTNLGIVLLLAPLARAALSRAGGTLRERLWSVLRATTVADAAQVYEAIRLAHPGGLGDAPEQDVGAAPTVTLRESMALAAARDTIAAEYVTDFSVTFDIAVPALRAARQDGLAWDDAVVELALTVLGQVPDTLIARKLGLAEAEAVSARAREALAAGGVRSFAGREAVDALDRSLLDPQNRRNPGTTADLTAAALFVVIFEDWSTQA